MLKEVVTYEDFDDVQQTETLYFNLTKTEMMDMLDLQPRLEAWSKSTKGDPRDLTTAEVKELLDIIKLLISLSYGERVDGSRFRKSPEISKNFEQTLAYDAFVFSLFQDPENAVKFMTGVLPKGLEEAAASIQVNKIDVSLPESGSEIEIPAYIREDRNPTYAEIQTMSKEELRLAFKRKAEGKGSENE